MPLRIDVEKRIIGLGVTAGMAAGLVSFAYARYAITPLVDDAIAYEEERAHAQLARTGEHAHEHEVFTRAVQENVGMAVGTVLFGVVLGALFAVGFCIVLSVLRRRGVDADPRVGAALLAVGAFVATVVVPFLAHPPNPPGVGDGDTVGARTTAHLTTLVVSVLIACAAVSLTMRLAPRLGGWTAATSGVAGYLLVMTVVLGLMPDHSETPQALVDADGRVLLGGLPADVLADFRLATMVDQGLLWLVIGAVVTCLLPRVITATTAEEAIGATR